MQLEQLVSVWGLPALVVGGALDGDTAALVGGAVAGHGKLSFIGCVIAVALGGALHDHFWFGFARLSRDRPVIRRILDRPAAAEWNARFVRRPLATCFVLRFLPGARTVGPAALGASPLGWPAFVGVQAIAVSAWSVVMTALGTGAGKAIEAALGRLPLAGHLGVLLAGTAVVAAAIYAILRIRRARSSLQGPRRSAPGPTDPH